MSDFVKDIPSLIIKLDIFYDIIVIKEVVMMVNYLKNDKMQLSALENINILGKTKNIMDTFFYERIFSDNAKNVVYREAEDAFKNQVDDETIVGIWQGEYWGKWVVSACEVYKYTRDEELKDFLIKAAYKIMGYAREDGYIGTYKNSLSVFAPTREQAIEVSGVGTMWNWNIWCRKYTLWGLIEVYEISKDTKILEAATKHAEQLIDELTENNISIADTGTFLGMPSCSILKPLLTLYKHTENEKVFGFAKKIIETFENKESRTPNLIDDAIAEKPFDKWIENPFTWAKVYEMTSCYEGIAEYYRMTGEAKYLAAAEGYASIMEKYERNLVGSAGYNDMFTNAANEINTLSEPCDSIHMMRLYMDLFLITQNPKYMEYFERIFYNAFLAGVFKDGKWGARAVRSAGRHHFAEVQAKFVHNHCCVNNMPRAFMNMAEVAITKNDAYYVNLYEEMNYLDENISLEIDNGYFTKGIVNVSVEVKNECQKIYFRNPFWSSKTVIRYNQKEYVANNPYELLTLQKGKNIITIEFDITPKIKMFDKEIIDHKDDGTTLIKRWLLATTTSSVSFDIYLESKRCTVTSGPLIMCKSKLLNTPEEEIFNKENLIDEAFECQRLNVENDEVRVHNKLTFKKDGKEFSVDVCDYASAGNEKLEDDKYFSIYF